MGKWEGFIIHRLQAPTLLIIKDSLNWEIYFICADKQNPVRFSMPHQYLETDNKI